MKRILFVFTIFSAGILLAQITGQNNNISGKKATIYNQKIRSIYNSESFRNAKLLIDSAIFFANAEHDDTAIAVANIYRAHYALLRQHIHTTDSLLNRNIPLLESLSDKWLLSEAYADKGTVCFYQSQYDSAIYYFKQSLLLTNNDSTKAVFLNNIAVAFYYAEQYDSSILYNQKSLRLKQYAHNDKGVAYSLNNIANIYEKQGWYDSSSAYYYRALQYCDNTNALKLKSTILNNIAGIYKLWNEYDKAMDWYRQALHLKKMLADSLGEANVETNIGTVFSLMQQYDSAEYYHKHAKSIYVKLGYKRGLSICYNNLGYVYEKKGALYNAVLHYKLSKKMDPSAQGQAGADLNIGRTYLLMKRYDTAEYYLVSSLKTAQNHCLSTLLQKIYFNLANLYEQQDKINLAYFYFKHYHNIKDSLASIERYKQITELESKYKTKQQQQAIKNLSQQKKIATQKLEIQALKLKKNRWAIIFLVFSIVTGGIVFVLWYHQKKLKAKHYSIELEQKLLRLQMNPHFISNALTSIQQFVLTNQPMEAARYLARFSEMMRNIIESSREEFIPLATEYKTIEHYLALQHLRFRERFDYTISLDEHLDAENILIPPMLAQPIVENAIRHAFTGITYKGQLDVYFNRLDAHSLELIILDNGIGFSETNKHDFVSKNRTSYSLQIIEARIKNLNRRYNRLSYFFEMKSRRYFDEKNGTFVRFVLPLTSR